LALIALNDAYFDFSREPILAGVDCTVQPDERIALVGGNGAGKSTLLAILADELELLGGTRKTAGNTTLRWLKQETSFDPNTNRDRTLLDIVAESAFSDVLEIEAALARVGTQIEAALESQIEDLGREQGRLQAEYERRDGYSWRARLKAALQGLGVGPELWDKSPGDLSGGERRRSALAAALLSDASVLLLDEPTNHLDLQAREWLEAHLSRRPGSLVIVSHDRYFLDRACNRTWELNRARLSTWRGNYSSWLVEAAERREKDEATWRRQQDKIAETEDFIRRNIAGQKTKQAQSRRKQLAKVERAERPGGAARAAPIVLAPSRPSGGVTIEATGLRKGYGSEPLFDGVDLLVTRGDRIGVVGPNGCGKSTLLKILGGEIMPDAGRVHWGHHVDLGHYDQQLRSVSDSRTVLEELSDAWKGATLGELRSFAGAFGFGTDMIDRPVGALSGGERGRLAMMRLIRGGHNTLLLDEPTNHLDAPTCEALEDALRAFDGTLVVVSHDRRFLERVCDRIMIFDSTDDGPRVKLHLGTWTEVSVRLKEQAAMATAPKKAAKVEAAAKITTSSLSKNEIIRREQWIAEVEETIAELEKEQAEVLAKLSAVDLKPDQRLVASKRHAEVETSLAELFEKWEMWQSEIDSD
jgi:ATP-binding cassette, subfamily F, member 3